MELKVPQYKEDITDRFQAAHSHSPSISTDITAANSNIYVLPLATGRLQGYFNLLLSQDLCREQWITDFRKLPLTFCEQDTGLQVNLAHLNTFPGDSQEPRPQTSCFHELINPQECLHQFESKCMELRVSWFKQPTHRAWSRILRFFYFLPTSMHVCLSVLTHTYTCWPQEDSTILNIRLRIWIFRPNISWQLYSLLILQTQRE